MESLYPLNADFNGLTRPIVTVWKGLLHRARNAKQRFTDRSDQVMAFYSGGPGQMWDPNYMTRFMGGPRAMTAPRFKITLNIAFEQVAVLGPLLFWEMADRKVTPRTSLQMDPMVLAGGNPDLEQYFNQLADKQAMEDARNQIRAQVLQHTLNYFQREQPEGGLGAHSDLAIFEALTKGAGFLRTEQYQFPFSDKTLVGSFFQSVDDVLVDGDCTDPLWATADWVAIRHRTRVCHTEEHFGLPEGSLREYATIASNSASYQVGIEQDANVKAEKDLVEWYEIFSRAGFGNKLVSRKGTPPIAPEFDQVRGQVDVGGKMVNDDFVYLCICPTCAYPLNLPSMKFDDDTATTEWVKQQTNWPTDYWRDNKWPVEMLAFYPHSGTSAWPEPPLAPALGELTCLNILMSSYVQEAYEGRQSIIGYKKGAVQNLQSLLTSDASPLVIEIDPQFGGTSLKNAVEECVSFMKRPEINNDLPKTIEFLLGLIEKRTGLSDLMYGQNTGANPRSAAEYQGKMDTVNIRPEYMQKKVAAWQSRAADKEVFCAYIHVSSRDIADQLGPLGVPAWDELVTNENPEVILRGSKVEVEASAIARPNKRKDMADLQGLQQMLFPILANHMAQTGDPGPLNGFVEAIGEAGEIDVTGFLIPPPQPNAMAEQQQQAELGKLQAETDKLSAEAEKARADAQATALEGETAAGDAALKTQVAEHGMMIKQQTAEHALSVKERQAQLASVGKQQEMLNSADTHEQAMAQRRQEAQQKLGLKLAEASQGLHQSAATHLQQTAIADQKSMDQAKQGNMITYSKMLNSQAEHNLKMQQARQSGAPSQ